MLCNFDKLLIFCGEKILSSKRKTQIDPAAIIAYVLDILPFIKFLLKFINLKEMNSKEVVFADGFSIAGSLNSIKGYWDKLTAMCLSKILLLP